MMRTGVLVQASLYCLRAVVVAVAALVLVAGAAEAIVIRHDVPLAEYDQLALQPQFDAAGRLSGPTGGTLIAPGWVLTAAHLSNGSLNSDITFHTAGGTVTASSDGFIRHRQWSGDVNQGYDLALIRLAEPVVGITPAPLYSQPRGDELGETMYMVGYGRTGHGLEGDTSGASWPNGVKSAAQQGVSHFRFGVGSVLVSTPFTNPATSPGTVLPYEGTVAPGDSGGAAFVNVNGTYELVGVLSYRTSSSPGNFDSKYGTQAGLASVSDQMSWIQNVVPELADPLVMYRETFNAGGAMANVGWQTHRGATGTDRSSSTGHSNQFVTLGTGEYVGGYAVTSRQDRHLTWTNGFAPTVVKDMVHISFFSANSNIADAARIAIRLLFDGVASWYATDATFSSDGWNGTFWESSEYHEFLFTTEADAWRELLFTPGSELALGDLLTEDLAMGHITAAGLFHDSNEETLRFDHFEIFAVPEPASLALVGLGGLMVLGRRRRRVAGRA